jgi:phosphoribosyl-dephospho-CoA transferase
MATATSDLDVLVRAPLPLAWQTADALLTHLGKASARLDVQIETPCGAIALAEYVRRGPRGLAALLVRTSTGPRWVDDPWQCMPPEGEQRRERGV